MGGWVALGLKGGFGWWIALGLKGGFGWVSRRAVVGVCSGPSALLRTPQHYVPIECTVADAHGIHARGLFAAAVKALGWTPESGWPSAAESTRQAPAKSIPYYFFVPEDKFVDWRAQQPWKRGSELDGEWAAAAASAVEQYVVCVPRLAAARAHLAATQDKAPTPTEYLHRWKSPPAKGG